MTKYDYFLLLCFLFQASVFLVALIIIMAFASAFFSAPVAGLYLLWFLRYLHNFNGDANG